MNYNKSVSYTHLDVYKRQGTAQTLVPVGYGIAVVVYAVEGDMHVRMLLVEMTGDEELRDVYKRPPQIITVAAIFKLNFFIITLFYFTVFN